MASGVYTWEELAKILQHIDEEVLLELGNGQQFKVIIVGGCALLLSHLTSRTTTRDIDTLQVEEALLDILVHHPEINSQAEVYRDRLPHNFENRLVKVPINTTVVDFYRPSNEDLAVMKLYSWRTQDKKDLLNKAMLEALDKNILDELIYGEDGAKVSSNTGLIYRKMIATYETEFLPQAKRIAKRAHITQWQDKT